LAKSLNLKDKDIENLQSEFFVNGKWVEQVRYNFPHCKGMLCQGLLLIHKRKTGAKKIILDYWLNKNNETELPSGRVVKGVSRRFVMGNYHKTNFKVKDIEEKIAALRKEYGNKNNLTWDLDIFEGEQLKKRSRYSGQLTKLQDYTVNQVIESFYKYGCPKINKPSESLNKSTLGDNTRYLIGYHDRMNSLKFSADEFNNGLVRFTDVSGIQNIEEFFIKYPPKKLDDDAPTYGEGISIYDSVFGLKNIRELTEFDVRNYLNVVATAAGTQRQIKECLSLIWAHAMSKSMLGPTPPLNPIAGIKIERPTHSANTKYDTAEYTKPELSRIYQACIKLRDEFVFQTHVILLMIFTGRRRETLLKLKLNNIIFHKEVHVMDDGSKRTTYGKIEIPKHVNKTKKPDKILITENVNKVLQDLLKQRATLSWSMHSDWMFPSTRIPDKHLLTVDNKANAEEHRIKDIRNLFERIKVEANLTGLAAMKMFRTTYENTVNNNRLAATTWDVISVTGRADTGSSEKAYLNKSFTPKVIELSASVDEEFDNIINIRKSG
jgi:integrase|tara:strand:+ start:3330 stop:4976 length:1647 start_codon:yes stop_codon:yes gene_type:complete